MAKPGPKVDRDKVARVLVDAIALGDDAAARKHNLSVKTVERYRASVDGDPNLSELVAEKRRAADKGWADGLAATMAAQIDFLLRAARQADVKDPEVIAAISDSLKTVSEVATTSKILDVRLAERAREAGAADRSVAATEGDASPSLH